MVQTKMREVLSTRVKEAILIRDGYSCVYCGEGFDSVQKVRLQLDHALAFSRGGSTDPDNLVVSCEKCNQRKGVSDWIRRIPARMPFENALKIANKLPTFISFGEKTGTYLDEILKIAERKGER